MLEFSNQHKDWRNFFRKGNVKVCIDLDSIWSSCLEGGENRAWAVFKNMGFGDYNDMHNVCSFSDIPSPYDVRREMLRRMLVSWNLKVSLCFDEELGFLDFNTMERVGLFKPSFIVDALIDEYESNFTVTEDEEKLIDKQSAILFAKNGQGVSNPCEAIRLFCKLSNFWDQLGLNKKDLSDMDYKHFQWLEQIIREHNRKVNAPAKDSQPKARVIKGGKAVASRAKVIKEF